MRTGELLCIIHDLIVSKREGNYWDFKQCHQANKAVLLHDILCMANAQHDNDSYIIFGIEDKTYSIVGIENDINRRNQQMINDFLRSKEFAGHNRPEVEMRAMSFDQHELDVLIIFNSLNTPYYLSRDYTGTLNKAKPKTVKANTIYTRIGDTNTPIDKSADYTHVEYLWKKRMGLHLSPFERLGRLLQEKDQWKDNEEIHYHALYPEFTLSFEKIERGRNMFYSYVMMNPSTSYGLIHINYYGTTLYSHQTVYLDSGRFLTVVPDEKFFRDEKYRQNKLSVRYYVKDNISYILHLYLWDEDSHEASSARRRFLEVVLTFSTALEKDSFFKYVDSVWNIVVKEIESEAEKCMPLVRDENEPAKSTFAKEIATGIVLNKKLNEYRANQGGFLNE